MENVTIQIATVEQKPVLANLLELYQYDFSEFDQADVGEDGRYGYRWLDSYWEDIERYPFLIMLGGKPAGFVLVNRPTHKGGDPEAHSVAEFFVLRKYRRQGIGEEAVRQLLTRLPGKWEILQEGSNEPSREFWRNVIERSTQGKYEESSFFSEAKRVEIHILSFTS